MNLEGLDIFVKVVQTGSFTHAAKALGMPITTVSGKVAHLEKRLGVTLIHRTTRKLHVTEVGEVFYRHCLRAIEEMDQAEVELSSRQQMPHGVLKLTATADVGHVILPGLIRAYLKKYPDMKVELILTNRLVDLVAENVDLALRMGALKDSSMLARSYVDTPAHLWASSSYLKRAGVPKHPKDLVRHQCVAFAVDRPDQMRLKKNDEEIVVPFPHRLVVDDMEAMKVFVMQGDGIGVIPKFLCEEEMKQGKLIKVLPAWGWGAFRLSFVYPAQRFVSPKVQSFVDFAIQQQSKAVQA